MNKFNETLEIGKQLINKNLDAALDLFEHLNEDYPYTEEVLFELGKIYYIKQNFSKAKIILEQLHDKSNYHLNLLLAKVYKSLEQNFSSLKIFLELYKKNKDIEIENEIVNLFLIKKQDYLAIKFLLKYNKANNNLKNILKIYINNITKQVANNKFETVEKEIIKAIKLLDKYTFDNEFLKEKNIFLNEYEIGNKDIILKSKPRYLTVALTNKCNLKCKMCYVWKEQYEIKDGVVEQILKLLPYVETIVWLGGEIFLYKNFKKLMDIANKYKIRQSIATNALLLTEDIIKNFLTYNLDLTISIDSINKETYEAIREGAKFEILLKKLELINKYVNNSKLELYINVVLSKYNMDEDFAAFIPFAKKYNVSKITYNIDLNDPYNKTIINNFNEKYRNKIIKEGLKEGINIVITVPQQNNMLKSNNEYEKYSFCLRPWKSLVIDINENIRSDCYCNVVGNLSNSENILSVWNNKSMMTFRKQMLEKGTAICGTSCKSNDLDFQRFKM